MTPAPIPDYLTKKEVEEQYGRSYRSLTRDFSTAVRLRDETVLVHLKLQTEDGVIRPGTEVTLEQIQELSNTGLSPTWYVEGEWAAQRYGTRDSPPSEPTPKPIHDRSPEKERSSDIISNELVRRLEQQIQDLQRDKEKLYTELSIKNEQIQQANDRTRESNVLMKELQSLLANVQERALLPLPARPPLDPTSVRSPSEPIESQETTSPTPVKVPVNKVHAVPSSLNHKKSSRPKPKAKVVSSKVPGNKNTSGKPKWYETPTLNRILRRRS